MKYISLSEDLYTIEKQFTNLCKRYVAIVQTSRVPDKKGKTESY